MSESIKTWMFRVPYEHFYLILSILLFLLVGALFYTLNIYVFIFGVIGGLILIKLKQAQYLGNAVRVYQSQFPDLFEIFKKHAIELEIERAALYIVQDPTLNAFSIGINNCSVILTSSLVEQFSKRELSFVIGHELGHFKAGHTKLLSLINPMGNGNIVLNLIFGFWERKTEYTSDRCGLLLTKDLDSAVSSMIKLAIGKELYDKMNLRAYLEQLNKADIISVKLSEMLTLQNHPFITNRIRNLYLYWKDNFVKRNEII